MAEFTANPTDTAICRLLAMEPLPTATIAGRLDIPERTVRHRLYRLRQAGAVISGPDGLHSLAAPVPSTVAAGPLPTRAVSAIDLAAPVRLGHLAGPLPTPAVSAVAVRAEEPLLDRAAPAVAADRPATDGPFPRHGWLARARTVLATAALGLAVAGGFAVMVRTRRMPPEPPAPPPTASGDAGDLWGSMRGPSW